MAGKETVVADSISANDLVVANNGNIYVTSPEGTEKPGKLYLIRPGGQKKEVDAGLKYPNGVALTPDQTQLYATESATNWVWIYQITADGKLINKQRYGYLQVSDIEGNAWADGLKCDSEGRVYVASRLGIQVLDQMGALTPFCLCRLASLLMFALAGPTSTPYMLHPWIKCIVES